MIKNEMMKDTWIKWCFILSVAIVVEIRAATIDYLTSSCNVSSVYVETSRHLECSTALTYDNNVNCYYSVYADAGEQIYLLVNSFELERQVNGACVDYVNIHDGSALTNATLNASPLCSTSTETNYTSTGNMLTVHFVTDGNSVSRGFDFEIVAITTGTCSSSQFSCSTGVCIDSTLQCNNLDECGDNGDEDGCPSPKELSNQDILDMPMTTQCVVTKAIDSTLQCNNLDECGENGDENGCPSNSPPGTSLHSDAALIAGLTVGLSVAAVIAAVVGIYCWRYNRWRVFMKRPLTAQEVVHDETTFTTSYPVTKFYYKEHWQDMYREPAKPKYFGYQGETVYNAEQGTHGMQNTTI